MGCLEIAIRSYMIGILALFLLIMAFKTFRSTRMLVVNVHRYVRGYDRDRFYGYGHYFIVRQERKYYIRGYRIVNILVDFGEWAEAIKSSVKWPSVVCCFSFVVLFDKLREKNLTREKLIAEPSK